MLAGHAPAAEPALVQVVLTLGKRNFCPAFDGPAQFKEGAILVAESRPAPEACP